MNGSITEMIAFCVYLVLVLAIGVFFFVKGQKDKGDKAYFLGGRNMNGFVAALSAGASDMSAWVLMGLPGSIYLWGMGQVWISVGLLIGTICAWVFIAPKLRRFSVAALGAGWLILHYFFGADAIAASIPLYSFVFLIALGEDYNIFMVSEIWKSKKKQKHHQAIENGVARTGSVITSAGLILAGTFAVLATLPIQLLVQFGVVTAVGVLLDTFIVRPLLVPAITTVLGRYAFWPGPLFKKQD